MKKIKYIILCLIIITTTRGDIQAIEKENKYIFGGDLINETMIGDDLEVVDSKEEFYDFERFFRPSQMVILNDENLTSLSKFYNQNPYKMNLPTKPFRSGKDSVVNYFNVLR